MHFNNKIMHFIICTILPTIPFYNKYESDLKLLVNIFCITESVLFLRIKQVATYKNYLR